MYEFLPIGYMLRGRYRILRVIGGGGMGAVYKAEDTRHSGHTVAVKEMRTDLDTPATHHADPTEDERAREREEKRQLLEAFRREAQILSDLRHPNLPRVTDFFTEAGRPYLVMELIPGESLEKKIDRLRGQPMDEAEALQYGIQVCRVLQFLHTQTPPIIFRDVKPANIMVMPNGQIKLIDFGIARTYKEGKRRDTMSMGTAAYAPFEQFGKGQTDARSDVYSLAATLYHLLTGRPPTPATTPTTLRDYNPKLSPATERLIIRAMSRDMNTRPQSAAVFEEELRRCLGKPYDPPIVEMPALPTDVPTTPVPQPASPSVAPAHGGHAGAVPYPTTMPAGNGVNAPAVVGAGPGQGHVPSHVPDVAMPAGVAATVAPANPTTGAAPHRYEEANGLANALNYIPGIAPGAPPMPTDQAGQQGVQHPEPPTGVRECPICGTTNQPKAHFCGRCGAALSGRPPGKLQVMGPNGVLWERRVLENPFNIGRRSLSRQVFPHLDLTYNDPAAYVSRQHARIVADDGGYFIEDLGSANGTYLNERRLPPGVPTRLRNGDKVRIGKVLLVFVLGN
jgi:serine/threonine-protein kinase